MPLWRPPQVPWQNIRNRSAATLGLSNSAADVDDLAAGTYAVAIETVTAIAFIKVHPTTADDVTTTTGAPLPGGTVQFIWIDEGDHLGGILGSGTDTLHYIKID